MGNQNATPWSDDKIAGLTKLYAEGYSCREIGETLGLSRNSVVGKVHRLKLPPPGKLKPIIRMGREIAPNRATIRAKQIGEQYKLRCVEIVPLNKTLIELEPGDCRYPTSDDSPFLFCGHPKMDGASYCVPHFHLCHEPPRPLTDKTFVRAA